MTICEICGRSVNKRTNVNGKMVCWQCSHFLRKGLEAALIRMKKYEDDANKFWAELVKIKTRPTYGSAYSAIPTRWMIEQAIKALNESGNYQGFYNRLSEMYRVDKVVNYADMDGSVVPEGAIACYIPSKKEIVSKGKTMYKSTAFHEWFHHLEHQGYVIKDPIKENSEQNAKDFANACIAILEGTR